MRRISSSTTNEKSLKRIHLVKLFLKAATSSGKIDERIGISVAGIYCYLNYLIGSSSKAVFTTAKSKGLLTAPTWLARYIEVLCQIGLDVHVVFFDGPEAAANMICWGKSLPPGSGHLGHLFAGKRSVLFVLHKQLSSERMSKLKLKENPHGTSRYS
jgi:hypothetical protein